MINTLGILLYKNKDYTLNTKLSYEDWAKDLSYSLNRIAGYTPNIEPYEDGTLNITCCPAKLLLANNLEEITKSDLPRLLTKLNNILKQCRIITNPAVLDYAHVCRLDIAKVVYIDRTKEEVFGCLERRIKSGRMKKALTLYPNEGCMVADSLAKRKYAFYCKSSEILQDKEFPASMKKQVEKLEGSLWRMELTMKTAQEIGREFKANNLPFENTVRYLFNEQNNVALLKRRWNKFKERILQPNNVLQQCKLFSHTGAMKRWLRLGRPLRTNKELLYNMAGVLVTGLLGVEPVKQIIQELKGGRQANRFEKDVRAVLKEKSDCVADIEQAFENGLNMLSAFSRQYLSTLVPKKRNTGQFCGFNALILLALAKEYITDIYNASLKLCTNN